MIFNNLLYFTKILINFICILFISILFLCLLNTMEIMSKVKYVFAKKINETEKTGIIEVYSSKILCFCDEESAKLIIDSIESKEQLQTLQEQLQTLQDFDVQELSCKTIYPVKTAEEFDTLTNAQKIIDDKTLDEVFGDSDFGKLYTNRQILNNAVLKYASGYETGKTVECICIALGLYTKKGLTKKGMEYLYAAYNSK